MSAITILSISVLIIGITSIMSGITINYLLTRVRELEEKLVKKGLI